LYFILHLHENFLWFAFIPLATVKSYSLVVPCRQALLSISTAE